MQAFPVSDTKVAVIGLGYVGLPLALSLAMHFPVVGYDANQERLTALRAGDDSTCEVAGKSLNQSSIVYADSIDALSGCNLVIITVPTPIDDRKEPDLTALRLASESVGKVISRGSIVVFESTVYPGVTEDVCGPVLEAASGLKCGEDFFLGYSPERINPGDKQHTVDKIMKVVAGQTPETAELLRQVYGAIIPAGVHVAPSIRVAEAAKVIENAQRDINIAFINEVTMIFQSMGIDTQEVLAAARTKWNFLDFRPGLVGGHCIGVDPFYLAHAAKQADHDPEVILAGRRINDGMAAYVADQIHARLAVPSRVLVLGLAFKENVRDLRNSKIVDLIKTLRRHGHEVYVYDPIVDRAEAMALYGIDLLPGLADASAYDAIVGALSHDVFCALSPDELEALLTAGGLLVDLKGIWREAQLAGSIRRWSL